MSAAAKALDALEAAGKAATPGPLIQDGRFVEVDRDGDFISEHFAQHNIVRGDPVTIGRANAALHVAAVNLSAPLAAVARAAMDWRKAAYYVKAESESASKLGLWKAKSMEAATRSNLFSALDALEAAAAEGGGA